MRRLAERYLEVFPDESARLAVLLEFFRHCGAERSLISRKNFTGHVTASGFVLSPDRTKLALVRHLTLGRFLQPGGHMEESDADPLAAARREVREETGLTALAHLARLAAEPLVPFDIDSHLIPANPRKGEPAHHHHDFRYLFHAAAEVNPREFRQADEAEWEWRPIAGAIADESYRHVTDKLARAGALTAK